MTYSEKLKSPKWQKKRLEIFNRDNFTCCLCKEDAKTLHVHHRSYKKNTDPWNYPHDNFLTVCDHCHEMIECLKDKYIVYKISKTKNKRGWTFIISAQDRKTKSRGILVLVIKDDTSVELFFQEGTISNFVEAISNQQFLLGSF